MKIICKNKIIVIYEFYGRQIYLYWSVDWFRSQPRIDDLLTGNTDNRMPGTGHREIGKTGHSKETVYSYRVVQMSLLRDSYRSFIRNFISFSIKVRINDEWLQNENNNLLLNNLCISTILRFVEIIQDCSKKRIKFNEWSTFTY